MKEGKGITSVQMARHSDKALRGAVKEPCDSVKAFRPCQEQLARLAAGDDAAARGLELLRPCLLNTNLKGTGTTGCRSGCLLM